MTTNKPKSVELDICAMCGTEFESDGIDDYCEEHQYFDYGDDDE